MNAMRAARLDPLESLRQHGFCVLHLSPADTIAAKQAMKEASVALQESSEGVQFLPDDFVLRTGVYPERRAARCYPIDPTHRSIELDAPSLNGDALAQPMCSLWQILEPVTMGCIKRADPVMHRILHESDERLSSFIDLWRYTGAPSVPSCAAHGDAGVVTVLLQDAPGLEVLVAGSWVSIELNPGEAAVIAGRMWEKLGSESNQFPCGIHRVVDQPTDGRVSVGFEVRPNKRGVITLAEYEQRKLQRMFGETKPKKSQGVLVCGIIASCLFFIVAYISDLSVIKLT